MATRVVEWHPFDDQFAAHSGTNRVELFDISRKQKTVRGQSHELALSQYRDVSNPVSCFNWWAPYYSPGIKQSLLALGTNTGVVSLIDWNQPKDVTIYDSASARRPCTGIAWNRYNENKLAAGFEKPRSQGEFCAIVWDIEGGPSGELMPRVFFKPASEEPTASICWLPHEPHLLAVGTSISWVRIYDTRMGGAGAECLAIMAHTATRPRKVKGIRPDPLQQHIIATFSDSAGEPIKIWDLRKSGPSAKPKLTIVQPAVSAVLDAEWSSARAGVLAVATSQQRGVSFYSTIKPPVETISRAPIHTIAVPDIARSISWQGQTARVPVFSVNPTLPLPTGGSDGLQVPATSAAGAVGASPLPSNLTPLPIDTPSIFTSEGFSALSPYASMASVSGPTNRLLIATSSGFADVDVVESVGLGVGAEGSLAVGSSKYVMMHNGVSPIEASVASLPSSGTALAGAKQPSIGSTSQLGQIIGASIASPIRTDSSKGTLAGIVATEKDDEAIDAQAAEGRTVDIEALMKVRSNAGYSMDASKNLQVLSDEVDALDAVAAAAAAAAAATSVKDAPSSSSTSPLSGALDSAQSLSLYRLWAWVDRVESLHGESVTLATCGVISLLSQFTESDTNTSTGASAVRKKGEFLVHPQLGIASFTSPQRRLAREICGWTDIHGLQMPYSGSSLRSTTDTETESSSFKGIPAIRSIGSTSKGGNSFRRESVGAAARNGGLSATGSGRGLSEDDQGQGDDGSSTVGSLYASSELEDLIEECEDTDSFERAVALAIWHGNLDLAVKVLQRTIAGLRGETLEDDGFNSSHHTSSQHNGNGSGTKQPSISSSAAAATARTTTVTGLGGASADLDELINSRTAGVIGTTTAVGSNKPNDSIKSDAKAISAENEAVASLLSLVAMCLAGYHNDGAAAGSVAAGLSGRGGGARTDPQQTMWASMCRHVVSQIESEHSRAAYLTAALRFLLDTLDPRVRAAGDKRRPLVSSVPMFSSVILDERLSLEDRVAFACSYLDDQSALEWLTKIKETCTENGDLGGLTVTGLNNEGLALLQHYLDRTDDIQTVALLAGRNVIDAGAGQVLAQGSVTGKGREWQWLFEYRNLLNQWTLFIDRAALDVELGRRHRMAKPTKLFESAAGSEKSIGTSGGGGPGAGGPGGRMPGRGLAPGGGAGRSGGIDRKTNAARVLYQLPPHSDLPHVFLRCNYCSSSLPVDPMQQTQAAAFLRKQRPIINCCPSCKKPLPRCYVCLLYMGLVNPHAEFNRVLAQRNAASTAAASNKGPDAVAGGGDGGWMNHNEEAHNMLDFGRWFFFCQHCKHGGHAACIDDWFGGREVCGVNGCYCNCRALK